MDRDIMMICTLCGCDEEIARKAYLEKNNDVLLAVDLILFPNIAPPPNRKRKREDMNEHEEYLNSMRKTMEDFDQQVERRKNTTLNPLVDEELTEKRDPPAETAQQNNCLPEYRPISTVEVVQIPETEYLQHPERSCD